MLGVSVAAMDGAGTPDVTPNYSGAFARTVTISDASGAAGTMSANTLAASAFAGGLASGSATASPVFSFTSKTSGPYTLQLRASDGETSSSGTVGAEATALHRSGRLRLSNAFGNAGSALQIPLALEYWGGNSWVPNSADSCSTLATSAVALSNPRNPAGGSSTASTSVSSVTLSAGSGRITLAAPAGNSGLSLDLALNLGSTGVDQSCNTSHPATTGAALPWLRSNQGSCASTADRDPAARASFGIFSPETRKTVHVRELF
jgi:MSHA biogenesis protein MshQ